VSPVPELVGWVVMLEPVALAAQAPPGGVTGGAGGAGGAGTALLAGCPSGISTLHPTCNWLGSDRCCPSGWVTDLVASARMFHRAASPV